MVNFREGKLKEKNCVEKRSEMWDVNIELWGKKSGLWDKKMQLLFVFYSLARNMLVSFHNSYFTARRKVKILIYKVYLFHFFIQIQETASVNQTSVIFQSQQRGSSHAVHPTNENAPSKPALECYWSCRQTLHIQSKYDRKFDAFINNKGNATNRRYKLRYWRESCSERIFYQIQWQHRIQIWLKSGKSQTWFTGFVWRLCRLSKQ